MNGDYKKILLANPDLFLLHYFGDEIAKLEDFHRRLITTATTKRRGLVLYPAGHGKTTLVSTMLPIWALCADKESKTAIIAKNEQDAKGIMRDLQAKMMSNEELIRDFGPFYDASGEHAWSITRLDVARCKVLKEGSIQIYGSKGNVLGKRFNWIICDDVVTEKNSATPEQRLQMREWFNLGVATMPKYPEPKPGIQESRITVVGTLFHPEDLYHDLRELETEDGVPMYFTQHEDAIVDEEEKVALWPARWTWDLLMQQKELMGTIDFNKRYRNVAVDPSQMLFKEEYIRGGKYGKDTFPGCLDQNYSAGDYQENWKRIAGFDPAIGHSKIAKFCAHLTLGVGSCQQHERCFWVIDLVRDQFTQPQQIDLIIDRHEEYDLFSTVIEVNGYQAGLQETVQTKLDEQGLTMLIEPHHTSRNNKPDPEVGVSGMSSMIERGMLHIPWADPHSRRVMKQLVGELIEFGAGRTDDTVMALWFAWKRAREASPRYQSFNRLDPTPARPKSSVFAGKGRSVKNPYYA